MVFKKQWVVGAFQCNCRLFACPRTGEALLVDPGDEGPHLVRELQGLQTPSGVPIQVKLLLHTHGHLDHVGGAREVKQGLSTAPAIALHRGDEPLYQALVQQGKIFRINYLDPLPVDRFLEDGEEIRVGDLRFTVIHTPGHSPGSISLRLHEDSTAGTSELVLTGDTLFRESVGRTDLWGADQDLMFRSIRERLLTLDGDTLVCPGHGPDSRIHYEKSNNPFLN
jgi:glyoxylase-like metal-dependent hydrolase (beta-lactamase superfamily II)